MNWHEMWKPMKDAHQLRFEQQRLRVGEIVGEVDGLDVVQ